MRLIQQHAQQARVAEGAAALDALVEVAQRLVIVAELQQLVRQIAVQHDVEAVAVRGGRESRIAWYM